jgi:hypothetical protein
MSSGNNQQRDQQEEDQDQHYEIIIEGTVRDIKRALSKLIEDVETTTLTTTNFPDKIQDRT